MGGGGALRCLMKLEYQQARPFAQWTTLNQYAKKYQHVRPFADYEDGFTVGEESWLGLKKLAELTKVVVKFVT